MTDEVISIGSAHVAPSSLLWVSQTVRGAFPPRIILSGPSARFLQNGSHIVPVVLSTTGQGLPQVVAGSVTTVWVGSQVRPSLKLRLKIRSISPVSLRECFLPSQNANIVPRVETAIAGIRNVW